MTDSAMRARKIVAGAVARTEDLRLSMSSGFLA
jgi:hypothetical protein